MKQVAIFFNSPLAGKDGIRIVIDEQSEHPFVVRRVEKPQTQDIVLPTALFAVKELQRILRKTFGEPRDDWSDSEYWFAVIVWYLLQFIQNPTMNLEVDIIPIKPY